MSKPTAGRPPKAAQGMTILKQAMANDSSYAIGWRANLSMVMQDEGVSSETANKVAARFMMLVFGLDIAQLRTSINSVCAVALNVRRRFPGDWGAAECWR
ncbi:MAG: hypothetical protein AAGC57_21295 [Pseudomonadota bacterium]